MNIKEIAVLCGVSPATVSKVLHNDSGISSATREKVLKTIEQYHYVPFSRALQTAGPTLRLISVCYDRENAHERDLAAELEKQLFQANYNMIPFHHSKTHEDRVEFERYLYNFESKGISGAVFLHKVEEQLLSCPKLVLTEDGTTKSDDRIAALRIDFKKSLQQAADYLLTNEHRRILCLLSPGSEHDFEGFLDAYSAMELPEPPQAFRMYFHEDHPEEVASRISEEGISAVIAENERIGDLLRRKLSSMEIDVPEEVSIILVGGCREPYEGERLFTSVSVPVRKTAEKAGEIILGLIERNEKGYDLMTELEAEIQENGSVRPFYSDSSMEKVLVVGNVNVDHTLLMNEIPRLGETMRVRSLLSSFGGKGANQAVGLGKCGIHPYLIACVGNDHNGRMIFEKLQNYGVMMNGVKLFRGIPTGQAYIYVDAGGESAITVHGGANERLTKEYLRYHQEFFRNAKYCLLSTEVAMETVEYTLKLCHRNSISTFVKPSSIDDFPRRLYRMATYFIPNELEAERLLPGTYTVEERAERFYELGMQNVIITLGANGCYVKNSTHAQFYPPYETIPVDVTGAADAFISAFAAVLIRGMEFDTAIRLANYAAGSSVTRYGVQDAMLDWNGISAYLEYTGVTDAETVLK